MEHGCQPSALVARRWLQPTARAERASTHSSTLKRAPQLNHGESSRHATISELRGGEGFQPAVGFQTCLWQIENRLQDEILPQPGSACQLACF